MELACALHRISLFILASFVHLGVYSINAFVCASVCSQPASQPQVRSKARWGRQELWEMKPSWTCMTFAHGWANRSPDTPARPRGSQGTDWKRFDYFPSLICDYPLTFPLSRSLLGLVSPSHSLLNDINWQEAEFSGRSQPFLQRTSYCFKYPWMDSASVCTKNMDRCAGRQTHTHTPHTHTHTHRRGLPSVSRSTLASTQICFARGNILPSMLKGKSNSYAIARSRQTCICHHDIWVVNSS